MRLEDDVDAAKAALPGCGQRGADLCRVVPVVVDDRDSTRAPFELEATIDAPIACQSLTDTFDGNVETKSDSDGGGGVAHVVLAGNMQVEFAQVATAVINLEGAGKYSILTDSPTHSRDQEIRAVACSVGHHKPAHVGQDASQLVVVIAGYDHPVKGDLIEELDERLLNVGHVAIAVQVLAVDVGDDRENRPQLEKRSVAFVGFRDEILRFAEPG